MADACAIGLDLGGTKLLAGAIAPDGAVLGRVYERIAGLDLDALLDVAAESAAALGAGSGLPVGYGIPSLIDRASGLSVRCNHLPLDGVPFGALMSERLDRPVAVDNDGNCAALAEWRAGAARGLRHVAFVGLGTGVAGGLVLDGRVYRGASGAGAELGHMVVDLDGPACFGTCPGRGCLEALCSGSALARDASAAFGRDVSAPELVGMARAGEPTAVALLHEAGRRLGAGLAGIAMAFEPEVIVVGGGVMAAGELLLAPAREELRSRAMGPSCDVEVRPASLGDDAGMVGAALLALGEGA